MPLELEDDASGFELEELLAELEDMSFMELDESSAPELARISLEDIRSPLEEDSPLPIVFGSVAVPVIPSTSPEQPDNIQTSAPHASHNFRFILGLLNFLDIPTQGEKL